MLFFGQMSYKEWVRHAEFNQIYLVLGAYGEGGGSKWVKSAHLPIKHVINLTFREYVT